MDISTNAGSTDIKRVGLEKDWFDYPKPVSLIRLLCEVATAGSDVVLDFFAGSATTAHAVMEQNAVDGERRQFILVQLGEALEPGSAGSKAGFETIAGLARERIRRAAANVSESSGAGVGDVGFRSLRVDTTNLADVLRTPDGVEQDQLDLYADSVKSDRTAEDLLFQVLLDWGLELTMSISVEQLSLIHI